MNHVTRLGAFVIFIPFRKVTYLHKLNETLLSLRKQSQQRPIKTSRLQSVSMMKKKKLFEQRILPQGTMNAQADVYKVRKNTVLLLSE